MPEPMYTEEQYFEGLSALSPVISTEVLTLILNQDYIMTTVVKEQNFKSQKYSLDTCIDECIEWMRDRGLFLVSTSTQRYEAAKLFLTQPSNHSNQ